MPGVPQLDLESDSEDEFKNQYEERKRDQRPLVSAQEDSKQPSNKDKGAPSEINMTEIN